MRIFFLIAFLLGAVNSSLMAGYTLQNGKLIASEEVATMSVQEHYSAAMIAFEEENWEELVRQCTIIIKNFPNTIFEIESHYYIAAAYTHLRDFQLANHFISAYLRNQTTPKHFEEAIELKFTIAEAFRLGARKHLFGMKTLPKWIPADEDALAAYEEVIAALPHDERAARALFGKGRVLLDMKEYKEAVEAFQTLIHRFPKHAHAVDSYLSISEAYLKQFRDESPDRDLLDLAEINLRKMQTDFPREELIANARENFAAMQGIYAESLFETARFYERRDKPEASLLYYRKIVTQFPETKAAALSQKRMEALQPVTSKNKESVDEIALKEDSHVENSTETSP